jgi:hypothetical protein
LFLIKNVLFFQNPWTILVATTEPFVTIHNNEPIILRILMQGNLHTGEGDVPLVQCVNPLKIGC